MRTGKYPWNAYWVMTFYSDFFKWKKKADSVLAFNDEGFQDIKR